MLGQHRQSLQGGGVRSSRRRTMSPGMVPPDVALASTVSAGTAWVGAVWSRATPVSGPCRASSWSLRRGGHTARGGAVILLPGGRVGQAVLAVELHIWHHGADQEGVHREAGPVLRTTARQDR